MKKKTVSIAIPAYNEEKVIVKLLSALGTQKAKNYKLNDMWVYSDGSTDNTVKLVKEHFSKVRVKDFKTNLGKNVRVNQIMKDNMSDILIQIDADISILERNVIDNLIKPMLADGKIGVSCAYHLAREPKSFVGKLSYFGFRVWDSSRASLGKEGIRYYCEGGMRAFSKEFTKGFRLPIDKHTGEDSYSFYYAIKNNYKVVVSKEAKVYIDLPTSYKDYTKQMKRFLLDPGMVKDRFDKSLVKKYETLTFGVKMKFLLFEMIKSPATGIAYLLLQAVTKAMTLVHQQSIGWKPIERK